MVALHAEQDCPLGGDWDAKHRQTQKRKIPWCGLSDPPSPAGLHLLTAHRGMNSLLQWPLQASLIELTIEIHSHKSNVGNITKVTVAVRVLEGSVAFT